MPVESKQWFEKIEINMKAPYQYKGGQRSHQTLNRHPPRGRHAPNYAYVTSAKRHFNGRPSAGYQASMQGPPVNVYQAPCSLSVPQANYNYALAIAAMPVALAPPVSGTATNLPRFDHLYKKFEHIKEGGYVIEPPSIPTPEQAHPDLTQKLSPLPPKVQGKSFVEAMKLFMTSYKPITSFERVKSVNDWGREALALFEEVARVGMETERVKSYWPDPDSRTSSDSDVSKDNNAASSERSPVRDLHDNPAQLDIQRHLLDIKPSPYPGGSPMSLTSTESAHTSDNDADDELGTSPFNSPNSLLSSRESSATKNGTIGRRPSCKKKLREESRKRPLRDSGYHSSSTDGGSTSTVQGSQMTASGTESDDVISERHSRPVTPLKDFYDVSRDIGAVSPTKLPSHLSKLLEAPWVRSRAPEPLGTSPQTSPNSAISTTSSRSDVGEVYHKHKKWITDEILQMIAVRDRLYKRMKKHPAPDIVDMYKKVRNMVVGMTRNAKRAHERKEEQAKMAAVGMATGRRFMGCRR
ncbi:unnamed protein product [Clavelina lepadiformis]|uniref:Uncharacterized protein n=1 Tax=Clavelina lepadiformis TaxID=159417 RepID=A0ABP0GNQ5_CLALP